MGSYTDNLRRKLVMSKKLKTMRAKAERLVSCAIMRDGEIWSFGPSRSHAEIRRKLADADPYTSMPGDREGFITSEDRFVGRTEAKIVALGSGQISPDWEGVRRELLSSDINW